MIFQMSYALSHQQITIQPSFCEVSSYVQTIFQKNGTCPMKFPWFSHDFSVQGSGARAESCAEPPDVMGFLGPWRRVLWALPGGWSPSTGTWGASKFEDFPSFGWCCDVMGVEYRIVCQLSLSVSPTAFIYVHTFFAVLLNSCGILSSKQSIGDTGYYQSWRWYCEYLTQTNL